jgi:hypothetical protein
MAQSSREVYWSAIVADFRRSGLTHVKFCLLRRISLHTFRQWLYRLRPSSPPAATTEPSVRQATPVSARSVPPAFLPVHVRPEHLSPANDRQSSTSSAPLELVLGYDRRIRIPVGFDPATLAQILDVLEERP